MANFITSLRIICSIALLFVLPLTMCFIDLKYSTTVVCAVATFPAFQEGHCIRTERGAVKEEQEKQMPDHLQALCSRCNIGKSDSQ